MKISAGLSGALFTSLAGCNDNNPQLVNEQLHNWAESINYSTKRVYYPASNDEIQRIISSNKKLKCLGSKHSFSRIADTDGVLVSTSKMKNIIEFNEAEKTITIEPGITYGELAVFLQQKGYALQNLASLPHISIAGACATATHGSGNENGVLASSVVALDIVDGKGQTHQIKANDSDLFNGAVVNLGALGIVTRLTLKVVPDFSISQVVYRKLPIDAAYSNFHEVMASGYSVSLFTDWSQPSINQVWVKKLVASSQEPSHPKDFYGAIASDVDLHPVESQSAENVTTQRGIAGPWFERLPHFKMGFKPSTGKELQSEFFVDSENAVEAIKAMQALGTVISPHLFISEIRSVKADEFWMSPAYQKDCIALHTTWHQTEVVEREMVPLVHETLRKFNAIPHWAKLSAPAKPDPGLRPKLKDFLELCTTFDPEKKFTNNYLQQHLALA